MTEIDSPQSSPQSAVSDVYHSALVRALVFQGLFAVLACLMLDGGIFRRGFCAVSVGYWVVAAGVLVRRPGEWGLRYLRFGMLVAFAFVVVAMTFGYEWILNFIGG